MEKKRSDSLVAILIQFGVFLCIIILPGAIQFFVTGGNEFFGGMIKGIMRLMLGPLVIYIVNYVLLIPKFLFKDGKKKWFYISNALLLIVLNINRLFLKGEIPQEVLDAFGFKNIIGFYVSGIAIVFIFQTLFILLAVGVRYIMRSHQQKMALQEAGRKSAEAELSWLKNQLNPHFLFNTLNNISSLTQINPDKAQESIGQLSGLLRYALYESNAAVVPLKGEVEFMEDYIDLMSLRCNDLTTINKEFIIPKGDVKIAPLLFISLIENAFKHGVNSRAESHIDIRMYPDGEDLVFSCGNSFFEKSGEEHIGSGIGLENLKRRLELIYPGAYKFMSGKDGQTYQAVIILKGLLSRPKKEETPSEE